jgi:molybdopterin synthase sulfur carrier subunit
VAGDKRKSMHEPKQRVIVLRLPSTLSMYSGGKSQIPLQAVTLVELLAELARCYPALWECLCTGDGQVRSHVKIFVNNALVTSGDDLNITLNPKQEVIVLPSSP